MADFGVKINDRAIKAVQERLLGSPLRKRLTAALEGVAQRVEADAKREWPEDRNPRTGLPLSGALYAASSDTRLQEIAQPV